MSGITVLEGRSHCQEPHLEVHCVIERNSNLGLTQQNW